jgi:hypothetical protein
MNGRTALGACLVLAAILAGATFLDRAQRLVPVYAGSSQAPARRLLHPDVGALRQNVRIMWIARSSLSGRVQNPATSSDY